MKDVLTQLFNNLSPADRVDFLLRLAREDHPKRPTDVMPVRRAEDKLNNESFRDMRISDAVERYLQIIGRPASRAELLSALGKYGCTLSQPRSETSNPKRNLAIAIGAYLKGSRLGKKPRFYEDEGGRIGLLEWRPLM